MFICSPFFIKYNGIIPITSLMFATDSIRKVGKTDHRYMDMQPFFYKTVVL